MSDTTTTPKYKFIKGDRVSTPYGNGFITGEKQFFVYNGGHSAFWLWEVILDEAPFLYNPTKCFDFAEYRITRLPNKTSDVPIGPVPEHRWIDNRIMELAKSIHDHIDRGHKVPRIWIEELTRHLETFNNR